VNLQNKIQINDISQFSDESEVCLGTVGRWGKYQDRTYRITIMKDVVFVHTWADSQIELLAHMPFKYTDDDGEHTVDENANSISVKGICTFSYVYR
jgi:hypothetical protein